MEEWIREEISSDIEDNLTYLKEILKDNTDIVFREFYIQDWKAAFIYIDGMADKILLSDFVLKATMNANTQISEVKDVKEKLLAASEVDDENDLSKGIKAALAGDTFMLLDQMSVGYVLGTRSWPARGVSEPSGETVVRGSREGFTETVRFNTALVRRRVRDTRFRLEAQSIGARSKTDIAILYIDDIVNKTVLDELKNRLNTIQIDAILDSGYIEQMIEDNPNSPFPQIQSTERPDVVAAALYEGRVGILVDNTPFSLIVPATLNTIVQSPDDYYQRWMHGSVIRIIRYCAMFISLVLPALYIAFTSFHTGILPTELAYSIAASREGVPFPAFVEVLIMEISLAFLLEAIVRLPRPIGATIGIVGGLIIGQAAVSAGIVSPIMIIIVSATAITEFVTSNYALTMAFRTVRFMLILASTFLGFYGIIIGLLFFLIHLIRLRSFGVPYLAPAVNPQLKDQKDFLVRLPFRFFKERPHYMKVRDRIRQK